MSSVYSQIMNEVDKIINHKPAIKSMMDNLKINNIDDYRFIQSSMYVYLVSCFVLTVKDKKDDIKFIKGDLLKIMTDKVLLHDSGFYDFEDNFFFNGNINSIYDFVRIHIVYYQMKQSCPDDDIDELFNDEPYFTLTR